MSTGPDGRPLSQDDLARDSAVRVAANALDRAQRAVDERPTAARLAERDRWAAELATRRQAAGQNEG